MTKDEEIITMIKGLFDDKSIDIVELRVMLTEIIMETQKLLFLVDNYEDDNI